MDWQIYLTPWNIGGAIFGCLLGIAAIVTLAMSRRQISIALAKALQRFFSPVGFFGLVIVVFMIISTLEAGGYFQTITHGAIFGLLGYALALGFDLVSIVCMQARLNATRMRDDRGAKLNLMGVCICAIVSAFANVAGALQGYQPAKLDHAPAWIQACAPWTSMVFPLLIVVLSMTTDHVLDHTPATGIDIEAFKEREHKRVEMLQIRLSTERELLTLDMELSTLRTKREQANGRVQREWFIWRWLRPVVSSASPTTGHERDLTTAIDQAVQASQAAFEARLDERLDEMNVDLHQLRDLTTQAHALLSTLPVQINQKREYGQTTSRKLRAGGQPARLHAHNAQGARTSAQVQSGGLDGATETDEEANTGKRILAAFQHLGTNVTDTDIARKASCARTTVGRWRKKLTEQGLLPPSAASAQEPAEEAAAM